MLIRIFISFIVLVLIPLSIYAQDENFKTWSSIEVIKKLNQWDFSGEFEIRNAGWYNKTERTSLELEAEYSLTEVIKIGSAYKLMRFYDYKYNDYQWRNRVDFSIQGKWEIARFSIILRERIEYTTRDESDRIRSNGEIDTYKINPEWLWRNRLKISYNIPKIPLEPAIAGESFYQLNNPDGNIFEKFRYTLSISYKLTKKHEIQLFSLINRKIDDPDDETMNEYVLGLGYSYKL